MSPCFVVVVVNLQTAHEEQPTKHGIHPPPHEFNLEYNPKSRLHECSALVKLLVLQPHTKEINRTVRAQLIKHSVLEDFQPPD